MALSQIQCLDDNHVNPRINESKPDFLYSEDQRLALEVLLREGRDEFVKFLEERQMRRFLSEQEQETLTQSLEPYDPGSELFPENAEENEPPLSLHYWPDLSDISIPQMDLGWPHIDAYRGVTRTAVYTQPPLEGQTHIKEIVRKMIAQAQKVIAVVMDVFTDVDIFRDLMDAGYRRKVSVYILVESTSLPHFLSMCQRANMHAGHLKHLRVRCTAGTEFYTRSCTVVKGRLGHRFMFIDGDKAVSGSFSFTWMSSRLDKNLVTVVSGQAVEAFDHLFRHLYMSSKFVDLQQVATDPEPERDPLPQLTPVVLPSTNIKKKLYNPKYSLLIGESASTTSAEQDNPKESQTPEVPDSKKRRRGRGSKEPVQEEECIHPGLINLEKAYLIPYLPTWPEPDPPSDVIGFINIMDTSKPTQVHLQRSERFETSQAIRFKNPLPTPKEHMPEAAKPKEAPSKVEKTNPPPSQERIKAKESIYDRLQQMDYTSTKVENSKQSLTSQDEGQATKHISPLSSNFEHRSSRHIDHLSEQKNRMALKTSTSSSPTTQAPYLPSPTKSNLGSEHTETETLHLMQANHTHQRSTSSSQTLDTSHPSSSSSSNSNNPALKPDTIHPATNDSNISNGLGSPNIKRLNSLTTDKAVIHKSIGENKQQTVSKVLEKNNRKSGGYKDDRKSDSFLKNQQHKQKETFAENQKSIGLHDETKKGNKKQNQSDSLVTNRDRLNSQEYVSDDIKTARPADCEESSKPQEKHAATTEGKSTSRQLSHPKSPNLLNETESDRKTYHVKENKPQRITYSSPLTMWERIQAAMDEPTTDAMDTTSAKPSNDARNPAKKNTRRASQENPQSPKEQTQAVRSASSRRTSDDITASTSSPGSPAITPEFRTPTSGMSDGHRSRKGSNRSTTSEEYFEAHDHDPDDTQTDKPNKSATNPLLIDYSAYVALFDNRDKHISSKERKVKMKDKEDVKGKDGGIKKTSNRDSKGKEGRNTEESKPKTLEREKEIQNQGLVRKSRFQRATGPNSGENRDGSAREVAGQKV